ncbi:MAG: GNAT family N-acetyltransferase [Spirochaetales bacterium]|jgi:ribosomal-protein-alanine N-acetyltransferase|nr:GNAT family N-acetyltransferase [Spirochaetales bacterium]
MIEIIKYEKQEDLQQISTEQFIEFLHKHLEEFGDPLKDIRKCLNYAFSTEKSEGGFALAAFDDGELAGTLIMNRTGMANYIPDWVLVYVAVDKSHRGRGIGKKIIEEAISHCDGDIKLHVEYDNPAKRLYEWIGFTSKYAEMRFKKD